MFQKNYEFFMFTILNFPGVLILPLLLSLKEQLINMWLNYYKDQYTDDTTAYVSSKRMFIKSFQNYLGSYF